MKKIGLIGGMSWESTKIYYELINKEIQNRLGGHHSARIILESVDFAVIEEFQREGNWNKLNHLMSNAAMNLETAGAEAIVLCTNTMHICSESIVNSIKIPFIHIVAETAKAIANVNIKKVILLGTRFTMEKGFYSNILKDDFNIEVVVPNLKDRDLIHNIIYDELVNGITTEQSKQECLDIINKHLQTDKIEGVILGCTEIPLLINKDDLLISIFDTTSIHALSAVDFMLN